ncbi:hypothetical protein G6F56_004165 [Rhizopus delemar]|nr:hypothetical protein G6F56_004165 [Rhizopus delemar]
MSSEPTSPVIAAEINSFEESDSLHIEGLEESVVTWVGREGRVTIMVDRKTRYFNALGMNEMLDLSSISENSQLSKFPVELQKEIKQLFPPPTVITPSIDERYTEIQQEVQHTSNENGRYYKRYLEKLNIKTNEKYGTTKKIRVMISELLLYNGCVFDEKDSKLLSGAITMPENIRQQGEIPKWISELSHEKMVPNLATGEIEKDIWMSKFYKYKLKTVLSSKMGLNQFVRSFPKSYESTLPVYVPFIIMAELEATVYALYLGSNRLYIINEITTISLPRTLFEVKDERILSVVSNLNMVKKLVADVKQMNQHITELRSIKKRKTINS